MYAINAILLRNDINKWDIVELDAIDGKLLRALQRDSQQSVQELGDAAGLSASACHRRIKALEEKGVIQGYRADLDAQALGFTMMFFIEISLTSQGQSVLDAFETAVRDVPEVLECHLMAGQADYILRVVCRDHEDFERLHRRLLSRLPGVARVHSNMSIRTVKRRSGLPI